MRLREWFIEYMKHRLVFQRKEINIEDKEGKLIINDVIYLIKEKLEIADYNIVTLNTKENLDFLLNNWEKFIQYNQKIYFVNTKTNEKWILAPQLHSKVAENKHIKKGLLNLFNGISKMN